MRALVLTAYAGRPESLRVETLPVPRPAAGQVLVRVAASPINPSDLVAGWGRKGFGKEQLKALVGVPGLVGRELETPVRARLPLESAGEAVGIASADMTTGKVLFVPGQGAAA